MKTAIVTFALGQRYLEQWTRMCRKGWRAYCDRHGYDLIALQQPLDTSARACARSPAWQKLLVLGQPWAASYDRIVWVDSDVCINPIAPSIIDGVPEQKIGAVDELSYPTVASRQAVVRSWGGNESDLVDATSYHSRVGLRGEQRHIVQTGVMVLSPRYHRDTLNMSITSMRTPGRLSITKCDSFRMKSSDVI